MNMYLVIFNLGRKSATEVPPWIFQTNNTKELIDAQSDCRSMRIPTKIVKTEKGIEKYKVEKDEFFQTSEEVQSALDEWYDQSEGYLLNLPVNRQPKWFRKIQNRSAESINS